MGKKNEVSADKTNLHSTSAAALLPERLARDSQGEVHASQACFLPLRRSCTCTSHQAWSSWDLVSLFLFCLAFEYCYSSYSYWSLSMCFFNKELYICKSVFLSWGVLFFSIRDRCIRSINESSWGRVSLEYLLVTVDK